MKLQFRYMDSDFLELLKITNINNSKIKRGRIGLAVLFPAAFLLIMLLLIEYLEEYILISFIVWLVFTIVWTIFSKDIYNHIMEKSFKSAAKEILSKGIDCLKDTIFSLDEEGIKKEIDGIVLTASWEAVDKVFVTETNIFIKLINTNYINIPKRVFENNEEQEEFLRYIDKHIKWKFYEREKA